MKKFLLILLFTLTAFGQKPKEKISFYTITQKEAVKKKGYRLELKHVDSDSRCPEGISCVWSGEVQFLVSVYKDGKLMQVESFSSLQGQENLILFSKYLGKKVRSIGVLPYPKDGVKIHPKNYYLKIGFVK